VRYIKLTEEQRKMVEVNHNLIYSYCNTNHLDLDEWYGVCAVQLCKAVRSHDGHRGVLSTLFYAMCDNLVKYTYRKTTALKRQNEGVLSLEYEYGNGTDNIYTLEDTIIPRLDTDVEDVVANKILLEQMFEGEYGDIIRLKYEGYTQTEISKILEVGQSTISKALTQAKGRYLYGEI